MAAYLPLAATLATGRPASETVTSVAIAIAAVSVILVGALRYGGRLSRVLSGGSDEALLLSVFGLPLLIGGLAQKLEVSAAIGAFLVGLALSGPVQTRAAPLIGPLRDLFAAVFFLFFSFQIRPGDLARSIAPALLLAVVASAGKLLTGSFAGKRGGIGPAGRRRAGSLLVGVGVLDRLASLGATTSTENGSAPSPPRSFLTAVIGPVASPRRGPGSGQRRRPAAEFRSRPARGRPRIVASRRWRHGHCQPRVRAGPG